MAGQETDWIKLLAKLLQLKAPGMVATVTAHKLLQQAIETNDIEFILWAVFAIVEEAQQKCSKFG